MLTATFFGRPRLSYAGGPLPWSAPPKTLPLLAYLVLAGGAPVERDVAAFALWPDVTDAQARTNLRRHIFYLERALPAQAGYPWVVREGAAIRLSPARPFQSDVTEFIRLAAPDTAEAQLESAQRLYRGELLEGYDEEWIVPERRRLYERYLEVLERLIAQATDHGNLTQAVAHADRLLQLEPWREHYVRTVMRLQRQSGDRCAALDLYADFSKRLQEHYNIAPSPETIRLKELIEENSSLSAASGNLPAALTTFIGRDAEVEELGRRLKQARLLTLTGIGGVGKTRLALQVAEGAAYRFDGGVWYVDFTGRNAGADIRDIVSGTLRCSDDAATYESLESRLRDARTLLILTRTYLSWNRCAHSLASCSHAARTPQRYTDGMMRGLNAPRRARQMRGRRRKRCSSHVDGNARSGRRNAAHACARIHRGAAFATRWYDAAAVGRRPHRFGDDSARRRSFTFAPASYISGMTVARRTVSTCSPR